MKLLGVCSDDHHPLSIITPWLPNGHARGYVAAHPESFRGIVGVPRMALSPGLVTLDLQITGTAAGLSYLHNKLPPIIHGDIRGVRRFPTVCPHNNNKITRRITS